MNKNNRLQYLISLTISIAVALLVGAGIMAVTGHDPLEGYSAMLQGAFGNQRGLGNTLYKAGQLCITGLATAVAAQAGIFNVGGEGQMFLGALASAWVGASLAGVSPWIALPVCILASLVSGAVYAWIPAVLKVKLKVNEVITTILMNSIAIYFCTYMANGPLKTSEKGIVTGTAKLSGDFMFTKLIPGSNLTDSILYIAVIALVIWYLMKKTTVGFEMKLTGQNSRFARYMGIPADKLAIVGMLISGAMCGLLGMFETFAVQSRFRPDFSNEFFFDGMLVAMIVQYQPLGIILMSFFFGVLKTGATSMQRIGISTELINIIQTMIIFFMAAESGFRQQLSLRKLRRNARKENAALEVKA